MSDQDKRNIRPLDPTNAARPAGEGAVARPADPAAIERSCRRAKAVGPQGGGKRGRLVFALDATMSRQPTWDLACGCRREMFADDRRDRRARRAARLFPRLRRVPGLALGGRRRRRSTALMDRHRLPRRPHADRPGAASTRAAKPSAARIGALVFVGDAMEEKRRRALRRRRRARPARRADVHVPGGRATPWPSARSARSRG